MSRSAKAEAVLALHRFGMGPRPGSIAAIEADPRGALIAELERPSASQLVASALPSSSKAFCTVNEANAKRRAKTIIAAKAQQEATRQHRFDRAEFDRRHQSHPWPQRKHCTRDPGAAHAGCAQRLQPG